jgi:hypothetical protein
MPKSFTLLLTEWQNRGLEGFRNFQFMNASPSLAQAYSKRKYLFDTIARRHREGDGQQAMLSQKESALSLDRERGARSMAKFYCLLHTDDDKIV